jgi:hypothetical protein
LEQLSHLPSALVQDEHAWSIYVSADAAEIPDVIYGVGVDPSRVSLVDSGDEHAGSLPGRPERSTREHARARPD